MVWKMPWKLDANGLRQVPESEAPDPQEYSLTCPSCGERRSYFTSLGLYPEWTWFCVECGLSEAPLGEWL